jgi:zinc transporter 1
LINGVFLVALCLSIFLEAIQRFFEPQEVQNPKLILVVGSLGLLSNILGLLLFHDHGHSHGGGGGHGQSSSPKDGLAAAEAGRSYQSTLDASGRNIASETGNIEDTLPGSVLRRTPGSSSDHDDTATYDMGIPTDKTLPISTRKSGHEKKTRHRRQSSGSVSRHFSSVDALNPHPASFRKDFIAASRLEDIVSASASDSEASDSDAIDTEAASGVEDNDEATDHTPLLKKPNNAGVAKPRHDSWHVTHKHNESKSEGDKGGHSHHDLNMRGVFLHVMGDALGNIGVIASALFIWLTTYSWRYYADPFISLVITAIILASAIPLCKAASRILLQAVPAGLNVDDIKTDIQELPGVASCHHLHVWQLNDTKLVASLHIEVQFDFEGSGSSQYMTLARAVRRCLHAYGIHSSTIQPEFGGEREQVRHAAHGLDGGADGVTKGKGTNACPVNGRSYGSQPASPSNSVGAACLLECGDECGAGGQCCAPIPDEREAHDAPSGHEH